MYGCVFKLWLFGFVLELVPEIGMCSPFTFLLRKSNTFALAFVFSKVAFTQA